MCCVTMECYSGKNLNEMLSFATSWMDPQWIMLSEVSQAEKDKYHFICMWNLNKSKWISITKQNQAYKEKPVGYLGEECIGMREIGEGVLGGHTSSYKINESRVCNAKKLFYPGYIIYFQI